MSSTGHGDEHDRLAILIPPAQAKQRASKRPLRFATFLAPNMFSVYHHVVRHIATKLGCAIQLFAGSSYEQLATDVDAAFVCGLAYVELLRKHAWPVEPLVAPVLPSPVPARRVSRKKIP